MRTYRFTARIKNNAGITPLKVGALIKGKFTYDLDGEKLRLPVNLPDCARYQSKHNTLVFQCGDLRFSATGRIWSSVSMFGYAEHFEVAAFDLQLPKGWEMDHRGPSQSYTVVFQNAPARKVIRSTQLPKHLSLSDFVDTRELRLDFCNGVRFPGGQVKGRATVHAIVESLE
jgi:hypothetical protein